jgi:hypothetical protein
MPRFFTLAEAESLLPKVEAEMREALNVYASQQEAESQLQDALRRISMLGGAMVNRDEISQMRDRRDAAAANLTEAVERIHSYGCQIKDLRIGLIDFPTMYRGSEVLLCWRFGEKGIHFWHGLEEGFRGRKVIDQDFLENHRGDRLN